MKKTKTQPPKWATRFLHWFCSPGHVEIVSGDLDELFYEHLETKGPKKAKLHYVLNVLDMVRPFAIKRKRAKGNKLVMFNNYFKITYRNFLRQKVYSTINLTGLAIGLACSALIWLYVQDELSYDSMHAKSDRIYRILEYFQKDGVGERSASNAFPMGPTIIQEYPHLIQQQVRFFNFQAPVLSLENVENNQAFNEQHLFLVDSTLFEVFDYELLVGHKETALDGPNSILLTETLAGKYFGEDNPLGKQLLFQGEKLLTVNGVLKDPPSNLHFQFDGLISFSTVKTMLPASWMSRFYWNPCWTYVLLHDNSLLADLESQLPHFVEKYFPEDKWEHVTLYLQPLLDIHLTSDLDYEIRANGNANNVYVFSTVAIFVLLIAAINFINLSSARATKRAKEVGIRKTLGSVRRQLVIQFIFESIVYTFVSAIIAFGLIVLVLPWFNNFSEKTIDLWTVLDLQTTAVAIGLLLFIGFLSGLYPALVLSSFKPVRVLRGAVSNPGGLNFRKVLVTLQFVVSTLLIVGTIVAVRQLSLLQGKELGFDQDQVVMLTAFTTPIGHHFETLRQEVERHPDIESLTAVEEIMGAKNQVGIYQFEGMDEARPFPRLTVRHDFIKTFDIELAAGRSYSRDFETDKDLALLVNEAFVRSMGWPTNEAAVGKIFKRRNGPDGHIVGVVKDFNYASKHVPIAPLIMDLDLRPTAFNLFLKYIAVRLSGKNMVDALSEIERQWQNLIPDRPLEYFFLDSRLAQSYKDEQKLSQLTVIFSTLAIFVACLGLFGLTTYITEQRTKEISIRKVLGIKSISILTLLTKDFIRLIGIAFVVTLPIAYILLEQWLSEFAYRITIGAVPFLFAGVIVLMVTVLTIGYHGLKAMHINPANTLKSE